jgi:hypothetical protein
MSSVIATDRFPRGVPSAVRDHGKVIDPTCLEPGDLILVSRVKPGWLQRRIQVSQGCLFDWEHARWHHALVSGGGTEVCEAVRSGVVATQYWEYMTGGHEFRVRRIKNASADVRTKVAYYAATMTRVSYGFGSLLPINEAMNSNDPWRRSMFRSRGVICSQLYFEACMRAGVLLAALPPDRVSPAHLSASKEMDDVTLQWLELKESLPHTAVDDDRPQSQPPAADVVKPGAPDTIAARARLATPDRSQPESRL